VTLRRLALGMAGERPPSGTLPLAPRNADDTGRRRFRFAAASDEAKIIERQSNQQSATPLLEHVRGNHGHRPPGATP